VLLQNCTWVVAKTGGLPLFKSFLAPAPLFNLPISTPPPSTTTEDAELKDINADPPPSDLNSDSPQIPKELLPTTGQRGLPTTTTHLIHRTDHDIRVKKTHKKLWQQQQQNHNHHHPSKFSWKKKLA